MEGAVGNTESNEDTAAANVTNMVECKICIIESSVCRFSALGEADRAHDKLVRLSNCTEMSRQVIKLYRTSPFNSVYIFCAALVRLFHCRMITRTYKLYEH